MELVANNNYKDNLYFNKIKHKYRKIYKFNNKITKELLVYKANKMNPKMKVLLI
jgi:hypothetical protein